MPFRPLATHLGETLGLLHPYLFTPTGRYPAGEPRTIWVLSPGDIPTTDIYIRTRLQSRSDLAVRYIDTRRENPPTTGTPADHPFVIIVRHTTTPWRRYLLKQQHVLSGVALLIDDDIPDAFADAALPLRYAAKTASRYARAWRELEHLCEAIWVSTPALQQKYADTPTRVVPPLYVDRTTPLGRRGPTYFYHGTAAHRREIEWLVDIVAEVQRRNPQAQFEIFGTNRVAHLYREIPRVKVLPPMPWREYLGYSGSITHAVGLAPLLGAGFNASRSHTKIFDITRCGAAGIYTDTAPFREPLGDGQTGVLCANDPALWIEHILTLLGEPQRCRTLYANALAWCKQHEVDIAIRVRV